MPDSIDQQENDQQFENWREQLVHLPRTPKRALLMINDFILLSFALWAAFSLRLSEFYMPPNWTFAGLLATAPLIGIMTFSRLGLYRLVTRFISSKGAMRIFVAVALAVLIWGLVVLLSGLVGVYGVLPRSVIILYGVLTAMLISASRRLAGWLLRDVLPFQLHDYDPARRNVVIFGAGRSGVQLAHAVRSAGEHNLIGFVDEDESLWGQSVAGLKVYRPQKMEKLISRNGVSEVLLALPEASRRRRRQVIQRLEKHPVVVKTLPAIEDIATGRVSISDLRPIDVEDLLGRDPVPPDSRLLTRDIAGKTVMITGAGGSIGSELTRQILALEPAALILFDASESALYEIENSLTDTMENDKTTIVSILGSVLDSQIVRHTISTHGVETIYHAAAYKHVPMVEHNPVAGIRNNTFGTLTLASAAADLGVARMVLISTDKAVRPTNIMGASKRLAELVLQAFAMQNDCKTSFTMVRFGNVLDSSGSVVRRFRQQIQNGGPVTVTHREIIRYFMSIPEAAQLVIQAGAMAEGGDVFVLDMGKPVKIDDLARSMIRLMGREVQDIANPDGEIRIAYTGLRLGEKLFEELLIGKNTTGTDHPRILRNKEPFLTMDSLMHELDLLKDAMEHNDVESIHLILQRTVEGYQPEKRHLAETGEPSDKWPGDRPTLH